MRVNARRGHARVLRAPLAAAVLLVTLMALPSPARGQSQDGDPFPADRPARGAVAPESRWGPRDVPDQSPDMDVAPEGISPDAGARAPDARPARSPDRRTYSYERDRARSQRVDPEKDRRRRERERERAEEGETFDNEWPKITLEAQYWFAELMDARFERERRGVGQRLDPLQRGFDLDETAPGMDAKIVLAPSPDWEVIVEYAGARFTGLGRMPRTLDFDAKTFLAGDFVKLRVQTEMARVGATWMFVDARHLRLGLPFGLAWYSARAHLTSRVDGTDAKERVEAITPYLGLRVDIPLWRGAGVDGEARVFGYAIGDDEDETEFGFVDVEARFYVTVADFIRLQVGYRLIMVDHEAKERYNDIEGDFRVQALTLGVAITF